MNIQPRTARENFKAAGVMSLIAKRRLAFNVTPTSGTTNRATFGAQLRLRKGGSHARKKTFVSEKKLLRI